MNGTVNVGDKVKGPAIALVIVGVIGLLFGLFGILNSVLGLGLGMAQMEQLKQSGEELPEWALWLVGGGAGVMQIVANLVGIACSAFVVYAGLQMQALKNHTLCQVASVIAMIPCISPCCCIGLPIGIWALLVLNKSEVRQSFN